MKITTRGYNIPTISFGTSITPGTTAIVGTIEEFTELYALCENAGIAVVDATISGTRMTGTMFAHCDGIGIELATVTNQYNTPQMVSAHLYLDGGEFVADVTIISLS